MLLSTHLIDEVSDLLEQVLLIDDGRLVLDEPADALRGRGVTIAGDAGRVEGFVTGSRVLHDERIGSYRRTLLDVRLDSAEAAAARAPASPSSRSRCSSWSSG